ncbi:hypothetical protein LX36DRAFT_656763 [Colletotrichum falcatum]|nr:hypothetical protein LX36DRAFT_656763 [Colletotrichum falcatum]
MKVTLLLTVLAMATSTLAADPKKHPGWAVPYENEPLPLHELPECYQSCMDQKNRKMDFDIYTVPRIRYCRDDFDTFFTWWIYHVGGCVRGSCNRDTDIIGSTGWMYKLCGFPQQALYSGANDWKNLPERNDLPA